MRARPVWIVPPAEIDAASVEKLEADLSAVDPAIDIRIDCAQVTFMDSAGIRAVIEGSQRQSAGGGSLGITNPSRVVRRLLEITDLTEFIVDEDD